MHGTPISSVLLITFNRPATTRVVLDRIRRAQVPVLYIFNDGPRAGNECDQHARKEIEILLDTIDWPCTVHRFFSEKNLGCGRGVSSAITWAFEKEDRLVILEDDCVPEMIFFAFCNDMLERYLTNERVWMVSGNNYSEEYGMDRSYTFSQNAIHIYGWATWKRCWNKYDLNMGEWPQFRKLNGFSALFPASDEVKFWNDKYEKIYADKINVANSTWDFQLLLTLFVNAGLTIVPAKNLVTNIGYQGAHNASKNHSHDRKTDADFAIEQHPEVVEADRLYDAHHWKYCWMRKPSVLERVKRKLMKLTN